MYSLVLTVPSLPLTPLNPQNLYQLISYSHREVTHAPKIKTSQKETKITKKSQKYKASLMGNNFICSLKIVFCKLPTTLGNIMRFFVTLGRAGATFLYQHMLMDVTVQLVFSAGDTPPERLSFPRNLLNRKV